MRGAFRIGVGEAESEIAYKLQNLGGAVPAHLRISTGIGRRSSVQLDGSCRGPTRGDTICHGSIRARLAAAYRRRARAVAYRATNATQIDKNELPMRAAARLIAVPFSRSWQTAR